MVEDNRAEINETITNFTDPDFEQIKNFDDRVDKLDPYDKIEVDEDNFDEECEPRLEDSIRHNEGKNKFWDYSDNKAYWEYLPHGGHSSSFPCQFCNVPKNKLHDISTPLIYRTNKQYTDDVLTYLQSIT